MSSCLAVFSHLYTYTHSPIFPEAVQKMMCFTFLQESNEVNANKEQRQSVKSALVHKVRIQTDEHLSPASLAVTPVVPPSSPIMLIFLSLDTMRGDSKVDIRHELQITVEGDHCYGVTTLSYGRKQFVATSKTSY